MSIDLDAIESRIAAGIYGDDRMSKEERNDAFSALAEIIAEVETLRAGLADIEQIVRDGMAVARAEGVEEGERRVVAYLRRESYPCCNQCNNQLADYIERGAHRKEEK